MRSAVVDQLHRAFRPAYRALRARQWRHLWLGPAAGLAVLVCAGLQVRRHPSLFVYSAATPWPEAIVRLPLSVVAPAQYLPWWGAVLQAVVVFACVQPVLGIRRAVGIGMTGHVLATLAMRVLVHTTVADVPSHWAYELDAGPSVAVLTVAVASALVVRSRLVAGLLVGGVLVEVVALPGQAGVEHLIGVAVGVALGLGGFHRARIGADTGEPVLIEVRASDIG